MGEGGELQIEGEVRRIWKDHSDILYNMTLNSMLHSTCVVLMIFRVNYFGGDSFRRVEGEMNVV